MFAFRLVEVALLVAGLPLAFASPGGGQSYLSQQALNDVLDRATPIAGLDEGCSKRSKTCDWMARFPDKTRLVEMNLPGTHDTSTWNYSDTTQASLIRYTGPIPPASWYRCQEHSIIQSLNEGIRVFDLRFHYNPGNDTIGFWHSRALLAPTTRMEDLFFALYQWLERHPTEAVLVSMNREGGTGMTEDAALYEKLYNILNTPLSRKYWVQTNGTLGTLGQARGKLTLLQRWSYDLLPPQYNKRFGIDLGPDRWSNNGKDIALVYNAEKSQIAYIEDYYDVKPMVPIGSGAKAYIDAKFQVTTEHITNATKLHRDQLYISFASAAYIVDTPEMNPRVCLL